MVAVLGYQIAGEFRDSYPIEIKELPFKSPEVRSIMLCHRRLDDFSGAPLAARGRRQNLKEEGAPDIGLARAR
jgi:hypothetical protein